MTFCVKDIHLVTDDGLYKQKASYKVKIIFIHPCLANVQYFCNKQDMRKLMLFQRGRLCLL